MSDRSLVVRIIGDSSSLERSFARSSRATKQFDHNFTAATRGVIAGSGVFRSFGRTLAFASGGFLAFGGASAFLRKSVDAAKEAQVANAQLATQLRNSGKSFDAYRGQIDKTIFRLSALAGIEDDELKAGLTTILRTVPDVGKALRDLGTAADLARARHISLAQAAVIIAKTEAGNTTLLRRQGFQIDKNATAEQALAKVRQVVAGQAAAGTTQQERFGAVLHQTEEIIGQGILPTLNKYLESGSRWLEQMNESGKLQKDVASAAQDFQAAVDALAKVIKTVDSVTGSFKNTLKFLGVAFAVLKIRGIANSMGLLATNTRAAGAAAATSAAEFNALAAAEGRAAAAGRGVGGLPLGIPNVGRPPGSLIPNSDLRAPKGVKLPGTFGGLGALPLAFFGSQQDLFPTPRLFLDGKSQGGFIGKPPKPGAIVKLKGKEYVITYRGGDIYAYSKSFLGKVTTVSTKLSATSGLGPHSASLIPGVIAAGGAGGSQQTSNASQRNSFFDNAISRILLRGGLGDINAQISSLQKADTLISQRLKVTKDVTRRLNLEDELLQNQAQIKTLRGQQTADALQAKADARQKALDALQAKLDARKARQFRELGLTAAGDDPVAGVGALKRRLGQLTANVNASSLNTPKLQSELKRFRKVLSEGIVPRDVRSKIKDMMDQIADQLKNSTLKNATKFRHTNANALLSGLGLDAETTRILRQRLAQVGPGGTVPGARSAAFSRAGASHVNLIVDGKKMASVVTGHQRRATQRRSESRRGPYAGRH